MEPQRHSPDEPCTDGGPKKGSRSWTRKGSWNDVPPQLGDIEAGPKRGPPYGPLLGAAKMASHELEHHAHVMRESEHTKAGSPREPIKRHVWGCRGVSVEVWGVEV